MYNAFPVSHLYINSGPKVSDVILNIADWLLMDSKHNPNLSLHVTHHIAYDLSSCFTDVGRGLDFGQGDGRTRNMNRKDLFPNAGNRAEKGHKIENYLQPEPANSIELSSYLSPRWHLHAQRLIPPYFQ